MLKIARVDRNGRCIYTGGKIKTSISKIILAPFKKERKYGLCTGKSASYLTKFLVNHIYGLK